jgi:hypothetical protein
MCRAAESPRSWEDDRGAVTAQRCDDEQEDALVAGDLDNMS